MSCRHCGKSLKHSFLDLGCAPPSNAYLRKNDLQNLEKYYPLRAMVCDQCWLVQVDHDVDPVELFNHSYPYFSSTSSLWMEHARQYSEKIIDDLRLSTNSMVIEVACNDGYLLRNFVKAKIPCLGIEPTKSTADFALQSGVPVLLEFFDAKLGIKLAADGMQADLIVVNNVFAHVPDINGFTRGLKAALKPSGTITIEFPHLLHLMNKLQFDTVYHEHYSYLSLESARRILEAGGLKIWHAEELSTHGGSLRVYACHANDSRPVSRAVARVLLVEKTSGLTDVNKYHCFQAQAEAAKNNMLKFLIDQKQANKKVVGYGAAAKANTILNFAGVKADLLSVVCDKAKAKQNKFMPGSHIPIVDPVDVSWSEVDYVLVFPWNIAEEIKQSIRYLLPPGAAFVTAVPKLELDI